MNNIILIGMPGAGKSTIGVLLAKALGYTFLDTDVYIQAEEGLLLQELLDRHGDAGFLALEAHYLQQLGCEQTVIATGGSAVYSDAAMRHLQASGPVVWLALSVVELEQRLDNLASRGVVIAPGQTIADLHARREPLYRQYADITVCCDGLNHEQIVATIMTHVQQHIHVQPKEIV